jgi:hypothetical protein
LRAVVVRSEMQVAETGDFGNPEEGECSSLEAFTKQWLMKIEKALYVP